MFIEISISYLRVSSPIMFSDVVTCCAMGDGDGDFIIARLL